tara:strand:+ start:6005 stop:6997 length:993 start_codon:yes stop_codon:yes gene_type:complete
LKKKVFVWCSDIDKFTGEGILANKFIKDLKKYNPKYKIVIKSLPQKKIILLRKIFGKVTDQIIIPIYGVIILWLLFISKKNKEICYINYLPLWNFLIFILLPPKTILGPVTGGGKILSGSLYDFVLRKILLNFFYEISILFINIRYKKILFSTELLKSKFKSLNNVYYNYVLKDFKYKDLNQKRVYDIIFYIRRHRNKKIDLILKLINKLKNNYKIITFGETVNFNKIKNLGKINKKKLFFLLQKTKYSFLSPENKYSLYSIDCLSNGVKVFYNRDDISVTKTNSNMIPVNYNNFDLLLKVIKKKLSETYSKPKRISFDKNKKFSTYFKV